MIAILDYGVGNLFSLRSSLQQLGLQAVRLAVQRLYRTSLMSMMNQRIRQQFLSLEG